MLLAIKSVMRILPWIERCQCAQFCPDPNVCVLLCFTIRFTASHGCVFLPNNRHHWGFFYVCALRVGQTGIFCLLQLLSHGQVTLVVKGVNYNMQKNILDLKLKSG